MAWMEQVIANFLSFTNMPVSLLNRSYSYLELDFYIKTFLYKIVHCNQRIYKISVSKLKMMRYNALNASI